MSPSMPQSAKPLGELSPEPSIAKPRRTARRAGKSMESRSSRFSRSEARRGLEPAALQIASTPEHAEAIHERRMTLGLRTSIGAAIAGMTLFFHAPLGVALAALLS